MVFSFLVFGCTGSRNNSQFKKINLQIGSNLYMQAPIKIVKADLGKTWIRIRLLVVG